MEKNNEIRLKKIKKIRNILIYLTVIILLIGISSGIVIKNKDKIILNVFNMAKIENPTIEFQTDLGNFVAELYPEKAPNTVKNIIHLAKNGYYNNKIIYGQDLSSIHLGRLENGQQDIPTLSNIDENIQKGSKEDIKYSIKGEFLKNGIYKNNLKHERYSLSIARADYTKIMKNLINESYDSGNSEILIIRNFGSTLDGNYACFGKIIKGQEVIDNLEKQEMKEELTDKNVKDLIGYKKGIKIKKVIVDQKNMKYNLPEYIECFDLQKYIVERFVPKNATEVQEKRSR